MSDEKQPLLPELEGQIGVSHSLESSQNAEGYGTIDDGKGTKIPSSSSTSKGSGRYVDVSLSGEKSSRSQSECGITLTWNKVNAFISLESKRTLSSCWKRSPKYTMKKKHILRDVYGAAEPGQLLAILGGSGAGKTTLLNVLTKRNLGKLIVEGDVNINNEPADGDRVRRVSAYVQQDDLFMGTLTVKEHLNLYALLRMGSNYTKEERRNRVKDVLTELGLKKCQDTLIGTPNRIKGISGGERKRLAFASEILTNPPLMFADEPTSGLDSFMAQQVVAVLKDMASRGKTIICTIHQPSSQVFAMFDRICLMAEGRIAYLGPTKVATELFSKVGFTCPENFNPADHYIRTLAMIPRQEKECRTRIKKICAAYENSSQGQLTNRLATQKWENNSWSDRSERNFSNRKYNASWFLQFAGLFWRAMMANIREPVLLRVRLSQTVLIAVLTGLIFLQTELNGSTIMNINGVLFQLVANMTFMFMFAVVDVFCLEIPIFMREHLSGLYRVDAYFLAKLAAETPQYVILPFLFCTIVYWMAGLFADAGAFFICAAICILTANVAISIGYMVSCMTGNISIALSVTPVIVIPLMLFGGFFINQGSIPVYFVWIKYISYFRYSYEAASINQWQNIDFIPGCEDHSCPENGQQVLNMLSFDTNVFIFDLLMMVVMVIVIRFIAFLALLIRTYVKK